MNNSIGIVAATEREIMPLRQEFFSEQIKYCITGVGGAATIYHTLQFISDEKPDFLIQTGIAGCFDKSISLASVFVIQKDRFADVGVVENNTWNDVFAMQLADANKPPYKNGWLINESCSQYNTGNLPLADSISVNEIITAPEKIKWFQQQYNPSIVNMEGAAFHYVCLKQNIPFIQVRSVSNYIGERDKNKWKMQSAVSNLNKEVLLLLKSLL